MTVALIVFHKVEDFGRVRQMLNINEVFQLLGENAFSTSTISESDDAGIDQQKRVPPRTQNEKFERQIIADERTVEVENEYRFCHVVLFLIRPRKRKDAISVFLVS